MFFYRLKDNICMSMDSEIFLLKNISLKIVRFKTDSVGFVCQTHTHTYTQNTHIKHTHAHTSMQGVLILKLLGEKHCTLERQFTSSAAKGLFRTHETN